MSKSTFRRLAVQIPIEEQPEFLAATFSAEVLQKALQITEPMALDKEELILKIHEALGGNGWAYSNFGEDELHDMRAELEKVANVFLELWQSKLIANS